MKEIKTTSPNNEENKNAAISAGRTNANETQTTVEKATGEKLNDIENLYFAIHNAVKSGEEITRDKLLEIYDGDKEALDRDREELLKFLKKLDEAKGGEA